MRWSRGSLCWGLALVTLAGAAASSRGAAVPHYLSVQGVLSDSGGTPITGSRDMTFRIYTVASGGADIWNETQAVTLGADGRYSVLLGTATALDLPFTQDYWLGIEVESDSEMTPRYRIASSAYAYNAETVNGIPAEAAPTPLSLLALDSGGKFPNSVLSTGTGGGLDADLIDGMDSLDFVAVAGDTMTGPLTLAGDPTGPNEAATKNYVDSLSGGSANSLDAADGTPTDAVYVDNDGRAGVGTTSPAALLHVAGSMRVDGSVSAPVVTGGGKASIAFMDEYPSATTPVAIPDQDPGGVVDTITIPDLGTAQALMVTVDVTNSNVSQIEIYVYAPDLTEYILYNGGSTGTSVVGSWPYPNATLSGDLTSWIGQNPAGDWSLKVIDNGFTGGGNDGEIVSWSMSFQFASTQTVHLKDGSLKVDGAVEFSDGSIQTTAAAGSVPVGGVVAWLKSMTGTPALPGNFVECNGQTLADPSSPYDGQLIPDLNVQQSFLRGAAASGATGGSSSHNHRWMSTIQAGTGPRYMLESYNGWRHQTFNSSGASGTPVASDQQHWTENASSLPPYYDVVWIMRIK